MAMAISSVYSYRYILPVPRDSHDIHVLAQPDGHHHLLAILTLQKLYRGFVIFPGPLDLPVFDSLSQILDDVKA